MAAYYYKNNKIITPFTVASNEPVFDMTTISLKTQRASQGHQRWELTFNVVLETSDAPSMLLNLINSNSNADTMIMPQLPDVANRYTVSGPLTISSADLANVTSVTVDPSLATGILPKGSFIKLSNLDKLYMVQGDVDLTGTLPVLISIYPSLRKAVTLSETVVHGDGVIFTHYRVIDQATNITFTDGVLSDPGTITLVEAI